MPRTAQQYAQAMAGLLPTGAAWTATTTLASRLMRLLTAWGEELARVEAGGEGLILREYNPLTASDLLTDWERVLGLPDNCGAPPGSFDERQRAAYRKLTSQGGQTLAYLEGVCNAEGLAVTLTEYDGGFEVNDEVDGEVASETMPFSFEVSGASIQLLSEFTVDDPVDTPVRTFSDTSRLQCLIERYRPAHTVPIYVFS